MQSYSDSAIKAGSGFDMNPSPGNIKDGLITDAIKSNGAAKKGGESPVVDVLDYTEPALKPGLSLVCTPGNDVEATTGKAASGATLILFTTGLGNTNRQPGLSNHQSGNQFISLQKEWVILSILIPVLLLKEKKPYRNG
jgi:altronate hydrolase